MNQIKIFHLVPNDTVIRSHLTFQDTDKIKHIYFVPSYSKDLNRLNGKTIITYNIIDILKVFDLARIKILKIKPFAVIISNNVNSRTFIKFIRKSKINMYFIQHGMWSPWYAKKIRRNILSIVRGYDFYKKAFVIHRNQKDFNDVKVNWVPVGGTTQIDYLLKTQAEYKPRDEKTILFLTNKKQYFGEEYIKIMDELIKFGEKNNYKIIAKIKRPNAKTKHIWPGPNNKYLKNKIVTVIADNSVVYDYYYADIIVIQTCGTSLIESLVINKPTILCQIMNKIDYMDINKYKKIPKAQNLEDLNRLLYDSQDGKIISSPKYQKQRQKFLNDYLLKTENCTEKVMKNIINDYYKENKK